MQSITESAKTCPVILYIARTTMVMTHGQPKQLESHVEDSEMWLQRECSQYCTG